MKQAKHEQHSHECGLVHSRTPPFASLFLLQIVYVGDGNNIVNSWLRLAIRYSFEFACVCPPGYEPDQGTVDMARAAGKSNIIVTNDPIVSGLRDCLFIHDHCV